MSSAVRLAVAAILAVAPLTAAGAATYTVATTLDLSHAGFAPTGYTSTPYNSSAFTPITPVTLAAGDTLDYTIDFKAGQTLTLTNPSLIWAFIYAGNGPVSNVMGTGTLSLLDATGNAFLTSNVLNDDEGTVHFGQQFGPGDFTGGLPTVLTFSGLHYVGTLDSYDDPTVTSRVYDVPNLVVNSDANVVTGGTVPEPATWSLLVAGFGLVGGAVRARRQPRAVSLR